MAINLGLAPSSRKTPQIIAYMRATPKAVLLAVDEKSKEYYQKEYPDLADRIKTSEDLKSEQHG